MCNVALQLWSKGVHGVVKGLDGSNGWDWNNTITIITCVCMPVPAGRQVKEKGNAF